MLVFTVQNYFAQKKELDSLKLLIKTMKEDTNKVNLLNSLCDEFSRTIRNDSLLIFLTLAKSMAEKLNFPSGVSNSYQAIGNVNFHFGNYERALPNYFISLRMKVELKDKKGAASLLNNIGTSYSSIGNYSEASKNLLAALKISETIADAKGIAATNTNLAHLYLRTGDLALALDRFKMVLKIVTQLGLDYRIATTMNNIGVVSRDLGNYPEALKYYFSALKIFERLHDENGISDIYINIGVVYDYLEEPKPALEMYYKALEISKKIQDRESLATIYSNIGLIYYSQLNYEKAIENYNISLQISQEINYLEGIKAAFQNFGNLYSSQGDYEPKTIKGQGLYSLSLSYYKKAYEHSEKLNDKYGMLGALIEIGHTNMKLRKYGLARIKLVSGLTLAKEVGVKEWIKNAFNNLAVLDSIKGDFKSALNNYKLYILYRDSLNNEENTKKTVQLEMQYEFDKKEADTKAFQDKKDVIAEEEKQKQKIVIASVSVGLILVLILAVVIFRSLRQNQTKNKIITLQKTLVEKQKEIVEAKQKEILDSIHYAKRIQTALITNEKYIEKKLKLLSGS